LTEAIKDDIDIDATYSIARFVETGTTIPLAMNIQIYVRPIALKLVKPDLSVVYDEVNNSLTLTTTNFAYYVYIFLDEDVTLKLSNNFFDLTPGVRMTVKILSSHRIYQIKSILKIRTLWDTYN
jgi:hypothetical protein